MPRACGQVDRCRKLSSVGDVDVPQAGDGVLAGSVAVEEVPHPPQEFHAPHREALEGRADEVRPTLDRRFPAFLLPLALGPVVHLLLPEDLLGGI